VLENEIHCQYVNKLPLLQNKYGGRQDLRVVFIITSSLLGEILFHTQITRTVNS
jgi:thiosulfate reductase cytochrome b subunit